MQRNNSNFLKVFAAGLGVALLCAPLLVGAATFPGDTSYGSAGSGQPPNCIGPGGGGGNCSVENPLNSISFCGLIKNILQAIIAIGMPIAVIFLVLVGFQFVWARGNPEGIKTAGRNLRYTVLGIAIFLGAWLIAQVIANTVNSLTQGTGVNPFISSCN